ncbi:Bug family tripartite tricarboxylate transporter substrate binding protein [Pseudoroseomonas globiformis]|uniref:Bug family tripartite tricarboxylate transporter substrate binding protein n=1 Tax=Teichococcus globiformis TaxID=2307229 RepID=A0ABV7G052_9PROT
MDIAGPPRRRLMLGSILGLTMAKTAGAQTQWPNRAIRFINPGPAGGSGDVVARIVMEHVGATLGQPVVIDNRPGAGTNIGMAAVAQSQADGYTIGLGSIAANAVNKWIYPNLPFDPERDFAAVSMLVLMPNIMVVPPRLPVRNLAEFIAWCRANAPISFGSVGAGSSQHLAGAQFGLATGVEMQHVPYTNSGQLNTDLMEGRTQVLFQSVSAVAEMVRAGAMRALAVTGIERVSVFPHLPTLKESGVDITSTGWFGVVAPAAVSASILDMLQKAVVTALADESVKQKLIGLGAVPRGSTREEFQRFMEAETLKYRDIIKASGASAN